MPTPGVHRSESTTLDQAFTTLGSPPRRRILVALLEQNPRSKEEFTGLEYWPKDRDDEAVRVGLHHNHLPKLQEAGFVDWDRRTGRVTRGPEFEAIEPLLVLIDDHRDELPDDWP